MTKNNIELNEIYKNLAKTVSQASLINFQEAGAYTNVDINTEFYLNSNYISKKIYNYCPISESSFAINYNEHSLYHNKLLHGFSNVLDMCSNSCEKNEIVGCLEFYTDTNSQSY